MGETGSKLTSTGTDKAWANINRVGVTWFHVDGREFGEGAGLGLVIVRGRAVGAAPWVVPLEEECASAGIGERRRPQLGLQREEEF